MAASCSLGHRCGSDLLLLRLCRRPAAVALIQPIAWELPCAAGGPSKEEKEKKKKKKKKKTGTLKLSTQATEDGISAWTNLECRVPERETQKL